MSHEMRSQNTGFDPATQPMRPDASLGELFSEMTSDLSRLFRDEVELAKVETRDELGRASRVGAMFGGAALAGWMTVIFLSFALAWLLDQGLNTALSFAIVGVIWAVAALIMFSMGRQRARTIEAIPQTRQTLKEDVQWARAQTS